MKRICRVALAVMIALLPLGLVNTQDMAAISLDIIGIDSTELSNVSINASILDASGQLVSGLDVDNFSIAGDLVGLANVTRVENVTDDDLAFASVLVIDTSSSMADRPLRQAKQAARQYVNSLRSNDPVAIVTFSSQVSLVVDYTTDRELLLRAIDSLAYGGQTALYDATYLGIETANRAPLPRRAVVILSDGGEYGDISVRNRDESIKAATVNGVPVYTVGLGWSVDRRFLEAVSAETNAAFYDSPKPEQLLTIFQNLAHLFRTQYIITLNVDIPADGMRYDFSLEVTAPDGRYTSGMAILRAPIPIPLLFLPDDIFAEALRENTQIKVEILADQEIESIEIALDGEVVSTEETYTIEPAREAPGEHRLDITVSDIEGDVGRLTREFEIAALPPTVSEDFEAAPSAQVRDLEVIRVNAGGQTEITKVEFFVDGELFEVDDEAPYEFNLDPFELSPGEHTLSIRATNASGQSTTVDSKFDVEVIAPRLEIEGLAEDTVISDSVVGSVLATGQSPITSISTDPGLAVVVEDNRMQFTLDPADLPPGRNTIAVRAVDAAGAEIVKTLQFEVAALPPTVELGGLAIDAILQGAQDVEVRAGGQTDITQIEVAFDDGPPQIIRDEIFTIPAEDLGDGEHEVEVTVRNAGGKSTTVTLPFTIALPPTPTATPTTTDTALPTDTPTSTPTHTRTPLPTNTEAPSQTALPTATELRAATDAPTATATDAPRENAFAIATDAPTETDEPDPTATDTPAPLDTNTPQPTDTSAPQPTDTSSPQPTLTDTALPTASFTPVPTETAVPTDSPEPTNTARPTNTAVPTHTPDPTETSTPAATETAVPTNTPIPTDTSVPTNTPAPTDTSVPTDTPIPTDTDTPEPTDTSVPTNTPMPTDTNTPEPTDTSVPTDTPVPTDTDTPVPTDTDTPVPT
ncbi:MAG: VWA domain-containing protein, partial [Chloroflexota bacterium]|nr:VWA domain-containing protein [Chloroflexota bacterium]